MRTINKGSPRWDLLSLSSPRPNQGPTLVTSNLSRATVPLFDSTRITIHCSILPYSYIWPPKRVYAIRILWRHIIFDEKSFPVEIFYVFTTFSPNNPTLLVNQILTLYTSLLWKLVFNFYYSVQSSLNHHWINL